MLKPISVDKQELNKHIVNVNNSIENAAIDIINYDTVTSNVLGGKFWEGSTSSNIELFAGYVNGDITKPHFVKIGDAHVHALMAGATGKGKTVMLHSILNYLRYKYSPSELAIYHADFKRMEGIKYLLEGGSVHHRAVTGTSLSSYVASLFKYIKDEMVSREKLYTFGGSAPPKDIPLEHCSPSQILARLSNKVGISSIEKLEKYKRYIEDGKIDALNKEIVEINTKLVSLGMTQLALYPTEMPRILFTVDEFQQAFEVEDESAVEDLRSDIKAITSKGRALGIHLFFASQNMSGTVPDDILGQFDLRFILNCSMDVSIDLLGNPSANSLDIGQAIVSEVVTDKDGTKGVVVKSPLITDEGLKECTRFGRNEVIKRNIKISKTSYFDETIPEQEKTLESFILKHGNLKKTNNIVLGKYCKILRKQTPLMFDVSRSKDTVLVVSTKDDQLYSALHTIIRNVDSKLNSVIMYFDSCRTMEFNDSYIKNLSTANKFLGVEDAEIILKNIKDMSNIYNNKTIYVIINKIEDIESLNKIATYTSEEEELLKIISKPPSNMRFILTSNKPNIKDDVLNSVRYLLTGYVSNDSQYELSINRALANEVNKCDYLMLYTDKIKGNSFSYKAFISNNYTVHSCSDELLID